jgi:hypothetical protein
MGVPFSWNQRSPSEALSNRNLMMLLLMQCLLGCLLFLQVWYSVAWYFTFATTAVTLLSGSGQYAVTSRVWKDPLVVKLFSLTWTLIDFALRFFCLVKVSHRKLCHYLNPIFIFRGKTFLNQIDIRICISKIGIYIQNWVTGSFN